MKRAASFLLLALAFLVRIALPALASSDPVEQTVTPIAPRGEQRVEPVTPPAEQRVEALDAAGAQQVTGASKSPAASAANGVAKVVLGVVAAGVSIGVMVASLLFF